MTLSRLLPLVFATALAAAAASCGRDVDPHEPDGATIPTRTFTAVLTELAVARIELLPDTAAYRTRIAEILATHQVTVTQLRAYVEGYRGNEDVLGPVYQLERARLDSLYSGGARRTPAAVPGSDAVPPPADTLAGAVTPPQP